MTWRNLLLWMALLVTTGLVVWGDGSETQPEASTRPATQATAKTATATASLPRAGRAGDQATEPVGSARSAANEVQMLLPRAAFQPLPKAWADRPQRLFAAHTWVVAKAPKPEVAAPPTAPPLPFTYLGMKNEDGVWQVFLVSGDKIHVVRQGDVLGGIYKIEGIEPPSMKFMYMPLQQVQILQIGVIE